MKHLVLIATLLAASTAVADRIYVDAGSTEPSPDGSTWASAFPTIQEAMGEAAPGDVIWVAEGTYDGPITMKANTQLWGGFAGYETLVSQRDYAVFRSVITGNGTTTCVTVGNNCQFDGFIVTDGYVSAGSTGSGILAIQKTGVYIRNTILTGNTGGFGAAIYAALSSLSVTNCVMTNNTAAYGPVAYGIGADIILSNCSASGNTTTDLAGGVHGSTSTIEIYNSVLWGNGVVEVLTSSTGNSVHLDHCLIRELPGQTIVYTRTDCLVNQDPLFFNADLFDLRLRSNSPCIDAGLEFNSPDIRYIERPQGVGTDIGAYEYLMDDPTDSDGDGIPDLVEDTGDPDNDNIPNYLDEDSDNNGVDDAEETTADTDNDGIPDYLDDDNDGNGIPDDVEGPADTDNDGVYDVSDDDNDGDGILDIVEGILDRDKDSTLNLNDEDADGDGIIDAMEGAGDPDMDNIPSFLDLDSNGNGIPDAEEGTGDGDNDGLPAFLDDDDTIPFVVSDVNGDGMVNAIDVQVIINAVLGISKR